jgi:hypothetical protein
MQVHKSSVVRRAQEHATVWAQYIQENEAMGIFE